MITLFILIIALLIVLFKMGCEPLSLTPIYPADIPQPAGARGWGYRDPTATYNTLLWEQNRPALLMPNPNSGTVVGYGDMSVPSAPVPIKKNSCDDPNMRPIVTPIQQRPVAYAPYANWASLLDA